MAAAGKQPPGAPLVSVEGRSLPRPWLDALTSIRIQRALGTVGRATLRFTDTQFKASDWYKLEAQVSIKQYDGPALFTGEVTGVAIEIAASHAPELVVTVDDPMYKMARKTVSRTFLNQQYSAILSTLIRDHSLKPTITVDGSQPEYTLQSGTDLAFLDAVSRRTDTAWWYDPVDSSVHVAAPVAAAPVANLDIGVEGVGQLSRFSVRASTRNTDKVVVRGWDANQGQAVSGESATLPSAESDLVKNYPGRGSSEPTSLVVTDLGPTTPAEAKLLATSLARESRSDAVTAKGETALDGRLAPGVAVKVDAKPSSGTYLISEVEHVYDRRGSRTSFVAGSHRPSGLVDLLGGERPDPGFHMGNVLAAIVVDVADETNQGRVKVRYPVPQGKGSDVVSNWARVVSLGGGPARGAVFIPEIDDEVLVAFEGGDTRRPVVLGGLFSESKGLPAGDGAIKQAKVNFRRIASRTGNLIELSDEAGKEHILIKHGKATHTIKVDKDDGLVITVANAPIKLTNGKATLELAKNGDINLTGVKVTIKGSDSVTVESTKDLKLKGTSGVAVEGLKVGVKASGTASVEATGPLTIKGATVAIN
ncbi:hypothetical protein BH11ACT8_BH11ACT8_21020 [soil metagenome]